MRIAGGSGQDIISIRKPTNLFLQLMRVHRTRWLQSSLDFFDGSLTKRVTDSFWEPMQVFFGSSSELLLILFSLVVIRLSLTMKDIFRVLNWWKSTFSYLFSSQTLLLTWILGSLMLSCFTLLTCYIMWSILWMDSTAILDIILHTSLSIAHLFHLFIYPITYLEYTVFHILYVA